MPVFATYQQPAHLTVNTECLMFHYYHQH